LLIIKRQKQQKKYLPQTDNVWSAEKSIAPYQLRHLLNGTILFFLAIQMLKNQLRYLPNGTIYLSSVQTSVFHQKKIYSAPSSFRIFFII